MGRLQLQVDPTFKAMVAIAIPGGPDDSVTFTFKRRTRKELDRFLESIKDLKDDVEMLMQIAVGWDLADEFNAENVTTLVDTHIPAPGAIFDVYLKELSGNRRKN